MWQNSECDKAQELKNTKWPNTKTKNLIYEKTQNWECDIAQQLKCDKTKNSKCDKTKKNLNLTNIKNSKCDKKNKKKFDKTKKIKLWKTLFVEQPRLHQVC